MRWSLVSVWFCIPIVRSVRSVYPCTVTFKALMIFSSFRRTVFCSKSENYLWHRRVVRGLFGHFVSRVSLLVDPVSRMKLANQNVLYCISLVTPLVTRFWITNFYEVCVMGVNIVYTAFPLKLLLEQFVVAICFWMPAWPRDEAKLKTYLTSLVLLANHVIGCYKIGVYISLCVASSLGHVGIKKQ